MNEYTELLEFPSGIQVDYETNLIGQFVEDRKRMPIAELVEKWKFIEPLMASHESEIAVLMAPPMLLRFTLYASRHGVNEGVVILQMWNHDLITKDENGMLKLVERNNSESSHVKEDMWNDITIGNGPHGCVAERVFRIKGEHNISEDGVSFWICDCFLGVGMKIFKDTEEGKKLQQMIEDKASLTKINAWLDVIVMKHLSPAEARKKVKEAMNKSFEQGRRDKADEVARVLNLKH